MLGAFAEAGLMSSAQPGLYAYVEALCHRDVCNPKHPVDADTDNRRPVVL
jgi:hypothetical protein